MIYLHKMCLAALVLWVSGCTYKFVIVETPEAGKELISLTPLASTVNEERYWFTIEGKGIVQRYATASLDSWSFDRKRSDRNYYIPTGTTFTVVSRYQRGLALLGLWMIEGALELLVIRDEKGVLHSVLDNPKAYKNSKYLGHQASLYDVIEDYIQYHGSASLSVYDCTERKSLEQYRSETGWNEQHLSDGQFVSIDSREIIDECRGYQGRSVGTTADTCIKLSGTFDLNQWGWAEARLEEVSSVEIERDRFGNIWDTCVFEYYHTVHQEVFRTIRAAEKEFFPKTGWVEGKNYEFPERGSVLSFRINESLDERGKAFLQKLVDTQRIDELKIERGERAVQFKVLDPRVRLSIHAVFDPILESIE